MPIKMVSKGVGSVGEVVSFLYLVCLRHQDTLEAQL